MTTDLMTTILTIKTELQNLYERYDKIIIPAARTILTFILLTVINNRIGYMSSLDNTMIVLVLSVLCGVISTGCTAFVCALFILAHVSSLSIEVAGVLLAVFLIIFLLYFRMCSGQFLILLLTPLAFVLRIPYVMPLIVGVMGGMSAAIAVSFGVVIYCYLDYIVGNAAVIAAISENDTLERINFAIEGLVSNQDMWVMAVIFLAVGVVVCLICKSTIDYAWTVAVVSAALLNAILHILAMLSFDMEVSLPGLLLGTLVSALIAIVVTFMARGLDYSRAQRVQFEDDEYYYYVKVVPKMQVPTPSKTVKRMNTPSNRRQ